MLKLGKSEGMVGPLDILAFQSHHPHSIGSMVRHSGTCSPKKAERPTILPHLFLGVHEVQCTYFNDAILGLYVYSRDEHLQKGLRDHLYSIPSPDTLRPLWTAPTHVSGRTRLVL